MLGAIVETVLAERAAAATSRCCWTPTRRRGRGLLVSFLLVPDQGGVDQLLARLGL
jgi:chemotaxis protein CheC